MTEDIEYILCYRDRDRWRVLTKTVTTEQECIKLADAFRDVMPFRIIQLKELATTTEKGCKVCGCPTFGPYCAKHKP